jgi:hypothetical protein
MLLCEARKRRFFGETQSRVWFFFEDVRRCRLSMLITLLAPSSRAAVFLRKGKRLRSEKKTTRGIAVSQRHGSGLFWIDTVGNYK